MEKITAEHPLSQSENILTQNITKLKEIFPEVFSENKVDFEKLQLLLGDLIEPKDDLYGLNWWGKADAIREAMKPSLGTLRPCKEESKNWDDTENLYIEGDNLEVLKLLQKSYNGKVKMIYIDPPYNTGKDFVYKDNFNDNIKNYLELTGQIDGEGKKTTTNTKDDGRFHSNWLNMMYPRLRLARNLLKEDGVIFISIDDNEVGNLRKICDEIFGEENFVGDIIRKTKSTTNDSKIGLNIQHENCLIFAKNANYLTLKGEFKDFESYRNPDNDPRGEWTTSDPTATDDGRKTKNTMEIINPFTEKIDVPGIGRRWRFNADGFQKLLDENRLVFKKSHKENERGFFLKRYKNELMDDRKLVDSLFTDNIFLNQSATKEVYNIFNAKYFDFPKPVSFIKKLIEYSSFNDDDIILDFFSGSATTAHATIELCASDFVKRKFILVQLQEKFDEKSDAHKANFKFITEIAKARILLIAKRLLNKNPEKANDLDLGFKVFKLDTSNIQAWDTTMPESREAMVNTLEAAFNNIKPNRTEEDILFELLLKQGLLLTSPIQEKEFGKHKVYNINNGELFVCMELGMTIDVINEIGKWGKEYIDEAVVDLKPVLVLKDATFMNNDALKTNAELKLTHEYGFGRVNTI